MDERQRQELRTLALGLPKIPQSKFDMDFWGKGKLDTEKPGFRCQYAGCAIGWAPKIIPNCGLEMVFAYSTSTRPYGLVPRYNGSLGIDAVMKYFGLSFEEAIYLFDRTPTKYDESPITTIQVSERILDFLGRTATQGSKL